LLSKNKKLSLTISLISAFFTASLLFAQSMSDKTVITGDELVVQKSGSVITSKGNSKAVSGDNILTSIKMTFDRKTSDVSATGDVKFISKTKDGEPITASGQHALYNTQTQKGKLWGENVEVKYFKQDSTSPMVLKTQQIFIDRNLDTITAEKTVDAGTVAVRPIADIPYGNRKGIFEADTMTYYGAETDKKLVMKGSVTGKIEMEDKIK